MYSFFMIAVLVLIIITQKMLKSTMVAKKYNLSFFSAQNQYFIKNRCLCVVGNVWRIDSDYL